MPKIGTQGGKCQYLKLRCGISCVTAASVPDHRHEGGLQESLMSHDRRRCPFNNIFPLAMSSQVKKSFGQNDFS